MSKTTITEDDIRLTAYAVGEMDAEEQQEFERLLADSPEAQAEVQAIRALSENLSSEFERELGAEEGQQPFVPISLPEQDGAAGDDGTEESGKVLRPRFWAFGTIATGLAAMVMVAVYTVQDTSFDRQGMSGDVSESAVMENPAPAYTNGTDAATVAIADDDEEADVGSFSRRMKRDQAGNVKFDDKAAGSLAPALAEEAAPGDTRADMPAQSPLISRTGRSVITIPNKDSAVKLPTELAKVKSGAAKSKGMTKGGAGAEAAANAPFDNASSVSMAEAESKKEMSAPITAQLSASGSSVGGVIQSDGAMPAAASAPMPATTPVTATGIAGNGGEIAPNAAPAPAPGQVAFRRVAVPARGAQVDPGVVGLNPVTAGNRSGGFAASDATIDALIADGEAVDASADKYVAGTKVVRQLNYARQPGGDRHAPLIDNPLKDPLDEAVSTFSIDVDTASYAQVRRSLMRDGQWPHPNEVRIEELINYFDYDYPAPDWDEVKAGDSAPFAVSLESAPAPWAPKHRLVSVGLKSTELSEKRPAANLVFLLDVSGSMNSADKLPLLQKALRALVPQLRAEDSVTMVAYAGRAGEVLPPTPGSDRDTIFAAIDALSAGGSTNGAGGITLAYQRARERFVDGGVNRVILATDGDFNVGVSNDDALVSLVEKQAQSDVFLTVLGFGSGNLNDSMMEKITNKGNGNYFYIDGVPEAEKVLVEQMAGTLVTVAKDVKIQVEFNPGKVAAYRLIGYANRMLKREDFDNDKVDAGEIGAGHTVTALYEVVPLGVAMELTGQDVEGLKYQKRLQEAAEQDIEAKRQKEMADRGLAVDDSHELLLVKLRYKQPTAKESALLTFPLVDEALIPGRKQKLGLMSKDFQFASAVAAFGMRLRNSPYISKDYSLAAIAELAAGVAEVDDPSETKRRKEFVSMVEKAADNEPSPSDGVTRDVQERLKKLR